MKSLFPLFFSLIVSLSGAAQSLAVAQTGHNSSQINSRNIIRKIKQLKRAWRQAKADYQALKTKLAQLDKAQPDTTSARRQALAQRLEKTGHRVAAISRALANTLAQAGGQELPGRLVKGAKQLIGSDIPGMAPPQPFTGGREGVNLTPEANPLPLGRAGVGSDEVQARLARFAGAQGQVARLADLP